MLPSGSCTFVPLTCACARTAGGSFIPPPREFAWATVKRATRGFDKTLVPIDGTGGQGSVYLCELDGQAVAVKRLHPKLRLADMAFATEVRRRSAKYATACSRVRVFLNALVTDRCTRRHCP